MMASQSNPISHAAAAAIPQVEYGKPLMKRELANTCEVVRDRLWEPLKEFKARFDYNGFHLADRFFHFLEHERKANPQITEAEAFLKFQPDCSSEMLPLHGSNCAGQSIGIVKWLNDAFNLEAHVIVETREGESTPAHAAVAIPCSDGVILLEIDHPIPIYILKNNKVISSNELQISLSLEKTADTEDMVVCKTAFRESNPERFPSLLRPALNPSQTVMKNYMIHARMYPVSAPLTAAASDGKLPAPALQVHFDEQFVVFQSGRGRTSKRISLDFSAFDASAQTIDFKKTSKQKNDTSPEDQELLQASISSGAFFTAFKSDKLKDQLFRMVGNASTMRNLYSQLKPSS